MPLSQAEPINLNFKLSQFYFSYFLIIGAFMPYWNLYLEQMGYNPATIGLLAVIPVITRIFAPSIWGYLADKSGKHMYWVKVGVIAQFVMWFLLLWVVNQFWLLVVVLFIYSFFQNAILAQFEAVTLFWLHGKKHLYGKIRLWGSLGFVVAVVGLGVWFDYFTIRHLPLWLLFFSALTVFFSFLVPEVVTSKHAPSQVSIWQNLNQKSVLLFFLLEFLLLLSHAPFYTFYSNYLQSYGYSKSTIGMLWAVGVVAEVVMFIYSAFFLKHFSFKKLVALCMALTALRWFIVGAYVHVLPLQVFAQLIHAFSFALFQVLAMQFLNVAFSHQQQGRAQAFFSSTWGLAVGLGGVAAGHYWQIIGSNAVFYIAAGMCVCALGVSILLPKPTVTASSI